MTTPRFTFKKEERLSRKKLIDELFANGSSFYLHPFKIFFAPPEKSGTGLYLPLSERETSPAQPIPVQILISVSTRNFKRAVDRNKIKRLIREAYRLNKHVLYDSLKKKSRQLSIAVLYTSKTIESFDFIQQKLIAVLNKLAEENFTGEKHSA